MVRVICRSASLSAAPPLASEGGQGEGSTGVGVQVKKSVDRWSRLALAVALMAALGLAACGRKSGLDPPPSAGLTTPPSYTPRPSLGEENYGPASPPRGDR